MYDLYVNLFFHEVFLVRIILLSSPTHTGNNNITQIETSKIIAQIRIVAIVDSPRSYAMYRYEAGMWI